MPTTDATALRGNISDDNVKRLAEKPWCAAAASPIRKTAPHSIAIRGANITGTAPTAHKSIVHLRDEFTVLPRWISADDIPPAITLPKSAMTYIATMGQLVCFSASPYCRGKKSAIQNR